MMDATVIRSLLLPATMRLLGTLNWWAPAPLRWLWQHIGLSEASPTPTLSPAFQVQASSDEHLADPFWRREQAPVRPQPFVVPIADDHETGIGLTEAIPTPALSPAFQAQASSDEHSADPLWQSRQALQPLSESLAHPVDNHTPTNGQLAGPLNVISTRTANGEEVMGPETLLWRYPGNDVVHGSLLVVESNHFCILKLYGTILDVYEAGQYMIKTPENPLIGSMQLGFDGEPIPSKHDALYMNRAKLLVKTSGVAFTHEMVEVDYSVDYYIHVATREDAVRLIHQMPYQGHTLSIQDISVYTGPVIEEAVSRVLQMTPLGQVRNKMQELSQLVHQHLREFLSPYGITLDSVKVLGLGPHNARTRELLTLKAFGLSESDTQRYYTDSTNNLTLWHYKKQQDAREQTLYVIWRDTLEEITTLETELEHTRANIELSMDLHRRRLHGLSRAITSELQANAMVLGDLRVPHLGTTPQLEPGIVNGTRQFRTPKLASTEPDNPA